MVTDWIGIGECSGCGFRVHHSVSVHGGGTTVGEYVRSSRVRRYRGEGGYRGNRSRCGCDRCGGSWCGCDGGDGSDGKGRRMAGEGRITPGGLGQAVGRLVVPQRVQVWGRTPQRASVVARSSDRQLWQVRKLIRNVSKRRRREAPMSMEVFRDYEPLVWSDGNACTRRRPGEVCPHFVAVVGARHAAV